MDEPGSAKVKHLTADQTLGDYLLACSTPPDEVVASLVKRTQAVGDAAGMMVPIEQAGLLTILAKLTSVRTAVDVGTFTGLSALALARGLVPGGQVITCDVTNDWIPIAREHWDRAGLADRIDFRLGPAGRTMQGFGAGSVDLVFIDADKMNYPAYYRSAVLALRSGGLLILDNVLLDGHVLDPGSAGDALMRRCAETLRTVNAEVAADERLEAVMLPVADGLTIARKH